MPGRTDLLAAPGRLVRALCAILVLATAVVAQTPEETAAFKRWDALATTAEAEVADATTSTDDLDRLREQLVVQRGEIVAVEQQNQPAVDELNQRLKALGPPPAEGRGP